MLEHKRVHQLRLEHLVTCCQGSFSRSENTEHDVQPKAEARPWKQHRPGEESSGLFAAE